MDSEGEKIPVNFKSDVLPQPGEQLRLITTQNAGNIKEKIKWQLSYGSRSPDGTKTPFNPAKAEMQIDGLLRGDFAERLSAIRLIEESDTVFSAGINLDDLNVIPFSEIASHTTKEGILAFAVRKSLEDKPIKKIEEYFGQTISDETKRKAALAQISNEIVAGYSASGRSSNAGIFYSDTVIPDAALVDQDGIIVGLVEVKAYFPDEFNLLLEKLRELKAKGTLTKANQTVNVTKNSVNMNLNLGPDLDSEVRFVDIFRNVGYGDPSLGTEMPILLRFPNDIPDDALKEYGEIVRGLGFVNLTIQKLPIASDELTKHAKDFVRDNLQTIKKGDKTLRFADNEIRVMEHYALASERSEAK